MAYPLFPSNPSPSPSSARSSTSGETREREKEKGVNVQVLVRCRPLHEDEQKSKTVQVIACNEHRREVTVHLNAANKQVDRSFTFDRVFGPQAQQKDLYDQAIVPIVTEVLEGFNCTVFAYGQTGTGKTYTMEGGGRKTKNGELPHDSGVIPRAVQQIFDTLDSQSADYSMKVTFLELYNEEITDLLATDDPSRSIDDKQRKPLTLMEDGKGGVLVRGLEEEVVYSASNIYALLERGSAKRRTAETLLNKQSSRSHSIFSITMHIKEVTPEGVEFIKCGKLNLVDLAGSENISRSGAKEGRAREAGEINKSLLTLGRVITSLVEHSGHVPYRDSKLTRLLRDSLGGRTKTCIIATISPSVLSLEETLSTLDYAHRAKNIKNRPEVNQKMMKSVLIKDLYLEIERLKSEVLAAREKNGVYIPRERYFQAEAEKKAMAERIEHMESESEARIKQVEELKESLDSERQQCADLNDNLEGTQKKLAETQDFLFEANEKIKHAQYTIKEREFVISNLKQSENNLIEQANMLQSELQKSSIDISELHLKIERKEKVETENHRLVQSFHSNLSQQLASLRGTVSLSSTEQQLLLKTMGEQFQSFLCKKQDVTEELRKKALSVKDLYYSGLKDLSNLVHMHEKDSSSTFEKLNSTCSSHVSSLEKLLSAAVSEAESVLKILQETLNNQENEISDFIRHQQQSAKQSMEVTKAISEVTNGFFSTLDCSTTALCNSVCESKRIQRQSIEELERKYEECALSEEKQLLEKMAEMLAASRARKSTLVHSKLSSLRDLAEKDSDALQKGMHEMQTVAVEVQQKWHSYETQAEDGYSENAATVSLKQRQMSELMQSCFKASVLASVKWKQAEESLQKLEKNHLVMVESVVREGVHGNGAHLTNFDQKSLSIQADVDSSNEAVIQQAQGALALDKEGAERLCASTATLSSALTELQTSHERGSVQIQNEADHCFRTEYQEDEPTCSTPRQRHIGVPSQDEIAALKAASMEQLVEEFRAANPFLSAINHSDNENCKSSMGKDMASLLATSPRVPLTSVNNL